MCSNVAFHYLPLPDKFEIETELQLRCHAFIAPLHIIQYYNLSCAQNEEGLNDFIADK